MIPVLYCDTYPSAKTFKIDTSNIETSKIDTATSKIDTTSTTWTQTVVRWTTVIGLVVALLIQAV